MTATWFTPQHRDDDLAGHPHRLEFRGGLNGSRLARPVPRVWDPARERVTARKVFVRRVGPRPPVAPPAHSWCVRDARLGLGAASHCDVSLLTLKG